MKTLQELANDLDFTEIDEFFQYIVESQINGNSSQVDRLLNSMQKDDLKSFIFWVDDYHIQCEDTVTLRRLAINNL